MSCRRFLGRRGIGIWISCGREVGWGVFLYALMIFLGCAGVCVYSDFWIVFFFRWLIDTGGGGGYIWEKLYEAVGEWFGICSLDGKERGRFYLFMVGG